MNPQEARAQLLQAYLQQDNLRAQLSGVETQIRDLRNFIAGSDAREESEKPAEMPAPTSPE